MTLKPVVHALTAFALVASLQTAYAQIRPEVGRPLQQASELLKAGRGKEALAKLRELDAVPNKTPAEQLTIDRMRGAAAARAGEPQVAISAFQSALASGKLSAQEQTQVTEQLAFLFSQTRQCGRARQAAGLRQRAERRFLGGGARCRSRNRGRREGRS
jgi:hypothetical protein